MKKLNIANVAINIIMRMFKTFNIKYILKDFIGLRIKIEVLVLYHKLVF